VVVVGRLEMMKTKGPLLALLMFAATAVPARAASVTIDSTNCNNGGGCYGLAWTLIVNPGTFVGVLGTYGFEALLQVTDDPLVSDTGAQDAKVISAVDFKVSSSITNAELFSFPSSSSGWNTSTQGLASGGCTTPGSGFVCSQSSSGPDLFTASATPQTWTWYFNTSDPIFTNLEGAHIGAKLVTLATPGQLLSVTATPAVTAPEPGTLFLLGTGLATVAFRRRRT
jgi:hypothetical protein